MMSRTAKKIKRTRPKKLEVCLPNDTPNTFQGKSCLIIGDGPSKESIDMKKKYEVDSIICVHTPHHEYTNFVCSLDVQKFYEKEIFALNRDIPLVLSHRVHSIVPKEYRERVIFYNSKTCNDNSGMFTIEWAIYKGFSEIYTAGIDFCTDNEKEYMSKAFIANMNGLIKGWKPMIYKVSSKSLLDVDIKLPQLNCLT